MTATVLLADRYEPLELLGKGGMAEVFRARDLRLRRDVAIKLLNANCSRDASLVERFRQESSALAKLHHPGIVTLLDTGETPDGRFFLVVERLRGETLDVVFRGLRAQASWMPWRRLVGIVRQVCMALQAAHERGIVHRDIKPSNLFRLADSPNQEDFIKILDFGIAKMLTTGGGEDAVQLTASGVFVGTPHYAAPEAIEPQIFGGVGAQTDVYSLGVILYQGIAGVLPHEGEPRAMVLYRTTFEEPPSLHVRTKRPIPAAVEALVMRAIARQPRDRFQSMRELADALAGVSAEDAQMLDLPLQGAERELRSVAAEEKRRVAVWSPPGLATVEGKTRPVDSVERRLRRRPGVDVAGQGAVAPGPMRGGGEPGGVAKSEKEAEVRASVVAAEPGGVARGEKVGVVDPQDIRRGSKTTRGPARPGEPVVGSRGQAGRVGDRRGSWAVSGEIVEAKPSSGSMLAVEAPTTLVEHDGWRANLGVIIAAAILAIIIAVAWLLMPPPPPERVSQVTVELKGDGESAAPPVGLDPEAAKLVKEAPSTREVKPTEEPGAGADAAVAGANGPGEEPVAGGMRSADGGGTVSGEAPNMGDAKEVARSGDDADSPVPASRSPPDPEAVRLLRRRLGRVAAAAAEKIKACMRPTVLLGEEQYGMAVVLGVDEVGLPSSAAPIRVKEGRLPGDLTELPPRGKLCVFTAFSETRIAAAVPAETSYTYRLE